MSQGRVHVVNQAAIEAAIERRLIQLRVPTTIGWGEDWRQAITSLLRAHLTDADLKLLIALREEVRDRDLDAEQVEERLAGTQLAEQWRALMQSAQDTSGIAQWLSLFIAIVTVVISLRPQTPSPAPAAPTPTVNVTVNVDPDEIARQIEERLDELRRESLQPGPEHHQK
jgi:hypothetical protein